MTKGKKKNDVKKLTDNKTQRISFEVSKDEWLFLKEYCFDNSTSIRAIMIESIKKLKSNRHGK